jgi:triacylglycerol esterase/lipase EstA (alpha/beta hydrolase family)
VLLALAAGPVAVAPAGAAGSVRYEEPVDATVVEPFHVEGGPYSRGNRGSDYGTAPGTEVRAAADGTVTFAGTVAGSRHVTVLHDDGVRTTYSYLDEIRVARGQQVRRGQVVGTTVGQLHLSARRGDAYFDPATLFGGPPKVRLVKFDQPTGNGLRGERSAIRQLTGGFRSVARVVAHGGGAAAGAVGDGVAWAADAGGQLARTGIHYLAQLTTGARFAYVMVQTARQAWDVAHRRCTAATRVVGPLRDRHTAVLVGGLGSTSTNASIDDVDVDGLGYRAADVVRYSYAGGRTPEAERGATFRSLPATDYRSEDTQGDLFAEGEQLADFLEAVAAAQPGRPIDVFAHSQGGVITRLALEELVARHGEAWLDQLGLVATMATPHHGADIATAAYALGSTRLGAAALGLGELATSLDTGSTAIRQLAETSEVIRHLDRHPLPARVRALSVAARSDPVVPVPRTQAAGATNATVPLMSPSAHAELPGDPRTTRELALALAGRPPSCKGFWTAFADQGTGEAISAAIDGAGLLAWGTAAGLAG